MEIRRIWSNGGWYIVYALFHVIAHPARERASGVYLGSSGSSNPTSIAGDYEFADVSASRLAPEMAEDDAQEFEVGPSTMRAITSRVRSNAVLLPLIIEPEAEMLPVGYKGVKPPGVSHMEVAFVKPHVGVSTAEGGFDESKEFDGEDDARYDASTRETRITSEMREDEDDEDEADLDAIPRGNEQRENKRARYVGSSHYENEDRAGDRKGEITKEKETAYGVGDSGGKVHNAAGYRNVYRTDEWKRDDGLYGNRHQDGHLRKRDRYGEKIRSGVSASHEVVGGAEKREKWKKTKAGRVAASRRTIDSPAVWTAS